MVTTKVDKVGTFATIADAVVEGALAALYAVIDNHVGGAEVGKPTGKSPNGKGIAVTTLHLVS